MNWVAGRLVYWTIGSTASVSSVAYPCGCFCFHAQALRTIEGISEQRGVQPSCLIRRRGLAQSTAGSPGRRTASLIGRLRRLRLRRSDKPGALNNWCQSRCCRPNTRVIGHLQSQQVGLSNIGDMHVMGVRRCRPAWNSHHHRFESDRARRLPSAAIKG